MPNDFIAQSDTVRDLTPDDWGRAVLEEVLFRAAGQVPAQDPALQSVEVRLEFSITPDPTERRLIVSTPGAVERAIITHLAL